MKKISILLLALSLTGCDLSDVENLANTAKDLSNSFSENARKMNESMTSSLGTSSTVDKWNKKVEDNRKDGSFSTANLTDTFSSVTGNVKGNFDADSLSNKVSSVTDKATSSLINAATSSARDSLNRQLGNHKSDEYKDVSVPSAQAMSHLEHLLIAFKGVANGQEFNTSRNGQNAIKIHPEQLYPVSGDYVEHTIKKRAAAVVWLNETHWASEWRCYAVTQDTHVQRDALGLTIDGQVQEYAYQAGSTGCSNQKLALYTFERAHINNDLKIQDGQISIQPAGDKNYELNASSLLLTLFNNQSSKLFGPAWAEMQLPYLANAAQEDNNLFAYDARNNSVSVRRNISTDEVIPFETLNTRELLAGQLFDGSVDSGVASNDWCKIVNIPHDTDQSQQYQSVIAMNCARSTPRWCDAAGSGFSAGVYPATHTIAWGDNLIAGAMENSREMKRLNAQGHFAVRNSAQNAFLVELNNAIDPIFGYTTHRTDGHDNNSGANSWTGHAGHCQNVMSDKMSHFAVSWIPDAHSGIRSYWTQDFSRR